MTAATRSLPREPCPGSVRTGLRQTMTLAWRTLVQIRHNPFELGDFSIQPIMFVLLFTYVFGGAIAGSTGDYLTFALPGIIVQNMLFVTMYVGHGAEHRPDQGRLRPAALAADRAVGAAGRPDHAPTCVKQAWSIALLLGVGMITRLPDRHERAWGCSAPSR